MIELHGPDDGLPSVRHIAELLRSMRTDADRLRAAFALNVAGYDDETRAVCVDRMWIWADGLCLNKGSRRSLSF